EQLNNLLLVRFLLLFASGWAFVQLLAYFETVIVIFGFAAILAFLLSYPVQWLRRFLPHGIAVIVVFLLSFVLISGLTATVGLSVVSQAQQLFNSVTVFLNSLIPLTERLEEFLLNRNIQVDLNAIQQQLQDQILSGLSTGITYSLSTIQIFFANFVTLILIAVVALFMLLDGQKLWVLVLKLVPKKVRGRFATIVKRKFLGFVRGQLILTLFLTSSTFIVFLILKVPFSLILATIVGVLDTIPGIGATLGVSIIFLLVLSQNVLLAFKVLIVCIILQQIQDNLIAPRVMQGAVNINPVVIFLALLVGARVAGLLGIFIAIPVTGVIVSFFEIDEMKAET
ncbi:MAG TPA: AI-2E family transporter, partial [Cyanobacteria bacterium UBA11049]|nr:AI-2E family transporter [Cyanobacteria bacterium UBA11049]